MLWVPDYCVFLPTPRAASRTVCDMLVNQHGGIHIGSGHHPTIEEARRAHGAINDPFWSLIRNPVDQLLSLWYNAFGDPAIRMLGYNGVGERPMIPFDEFIATYKIDTILEYGLNPYAEVTDFFHPYEAGLRLFFKRMRLPYRSPESIGVTRKDIGRPEITKRTLDIIWEHYPKDMELYEQYGLSAAA